MSVLSKFSINNKPVHMQKVLTASDGEFSVSCIRPFDYKSEKDYEAWCDIVNSAYAEEHYTPESAEKTLLEHSFLYETETYFYLDESNKPIGTISIGRYRSSPDIAGDFRLAVYPSCQNMGIGGKLIKFANHKMYLNGFRVAESIISYKRNTSLYLHCKCGYKPQGDIEKWALSSNFFNRFLGFDRRTVKKAEKIYQMYLKNHGSEI